MIVKKHWCFEVTKCLMRGIYFLLLFLIFFSFSSVLSWIFREDHFTSIAHIIKIIWIKKPSVSPPRGQKKIVLVLLQQLFKISVLFTHSIIYTLCTLVILNPILSLKLHFNSFQFLFLSPAASAAQNGMVASSFPHPQLPKCN